MYAKAFFDTMNFDSITVAPYMGIDSIEPFLNYKDKHTILLALTSNKGAFDFQTKQIKETNKNLYENVIKTSLTWSNSNQLMYVIGATKASYLKDVRKLIPDSFLLIPGVGAQGGDLNDVCKYGMNSDVGLLINSSRAIIYSSPNHDFADAAKNSAINLQIKMRDILMENNII